MLKYLHLCHCKTPIADSDKANSHRKFLDGSLLLYACYTPRSPIAISHRSIERGPFVTIAYISRYPIVIHLSDRGKLMGLFVMHPLLLRYVILLSLYRNNKELFIYFYKTDLCSFKRFIMYSFFRTF